MRPILFSLMCFVWGFAVSADVLVFPSKVSPGKVVARSSSGTYTFVERGYRGEMDNPRHRFFPYDGNESSDGAGVEA